MQLNWEELDLRLLRFAIVVAEKRAFLEAAKHLQLDQGFLSRQIKGLENKLGFALFDRSQRPLAITEAGQVFLKEARLILGQIEQSIEYAQQIHRGDRGRLAIGVNTSIANSLLPHILQTFYQNHPNVKLTLHELASYEQIEKLKKQQLDVGFFHLHNLHHLQSSPSDVPLATRSILQEPLVVVLPEHHRFAKQTSISLAVLANEPFILPPYSLLYGLREQIEQLCTQIGFKPRVRQEAAWISTVLSLVSSGIGISILPANAKNLQRVGVVYRSIKGNSPILEIAAVWRQGNQSATLQNFLAALDRLGCIR